MSLLTTLTGTGVAQVYHPFRFLAEPMARWLPNAGGEPRQMAEATQERKLLGVGSTAMFK
jgi:hypothetical protein